MSFNVGSRALLRMSGYQVTLFKTSLPNAGIGLSLALLIGLNLVWPVFSALPVSGQSNKEAALKQLSAGVELLKQNKGNEALKAFEAAARLDPRLPAAYNNMGRIYADQGNTGKAITYFKKAINIEPLYEPALSNLGLLLYSTGKPEDAIHPWRLCLSGEGKNSPTIHYYLANALRDAGNKAEKGDKESLLREAREHYVTAIKLDPESAASYSGLSVVDLSEGRLDDAYNNVMKSLKLRPDSSFSYYHLGLIEERRGRQSEAVKAFEQSLKYETEPKYKEETRLRIARLKGQPVEQPRENAHQMDSTEAALAQLRSRSFLALKKHNYAEALQGLDYLVKNGAGEDPIVLNNYALALSNSGQTGKAIEYFRKALLFRPNGFMEAQYNLGMALRRQGDNDGAEAAFRKAVDDGAQTKKTCPAAQNMLGVILREKGDYKGADRAFRKAILQSGGELPVAHFNLAVLLERVERTRDAVNEYKTYLRQAPTGRNARVARDRLVRLTGSSG